MSSYLFLLMLFIASAIAAEQHPDLESEIGRFKITVKNNFKNPKPGVAASVFQTFKDFVNEQDQQLIKNRMDAIAKNQSDRIEWAKFIMRQQNGQGKLMKDGKYAWRQPSSFAVRPIDSSAEEPSEHTDRAEIENQKKRNEQQMFDYFHL